jgi:CRAL/TRIO domain
MNATHQPQPTDPTMTLSLAEKARALQIKAAVEADPRLSTLADFEYVQYALTCADESLEMVCQKVHLLQAFKQEYQILDEAVQGCQAFHELLHLQPGYMLAVEYLPSTRNYIKIADMAAFQPSRVQTKGQWGIFLGGLFYIYQCLNPSFEAMRTGISSMLECEGASMDTFNPGLLEKTASELLQFYPKNVKEVFFLNSGTAANLMYACLKRFLPKRIQQMIKLGYKTDGMHEGQRIDSLYLTPTPEKAQERMALKVLQLLALRYQNQRAFSLDDVALRD